MNHSESIGNIAAAIGKVVQECGYVASDATNAFHRYSYLSDEKLLGHVRGSMASHGLAIVPMTVTHEKEEVKTAKGKTEVLVTTTTTFLLSHSSGEWMHVQCLAMGQDSGDKGPYKAATGALKYALRQVFLIATGDDAEKESQEARQSEEQARKAALGIDDKGHTAFWRAEGQKICIQLSNAGTSYNDVAAWTEALGQGLPSGMEEERVRKLVAGLITPDSVLRQKFNAWTAKPPKRRGATNPTYQSRPDLQHSQIDEGDARAYGVPG